MEQLIEIFKRLLELTDTSYVRYLHKQIAWPARMIGIVGARGVGKTTLLLQHIKLYLSPSDTLFVNADDIYFAEHKLIDLVSTFYKRGGKHIFIDEVHKYANWSKELKMMYDYYPDLQIVFTGSSILDIYKGNADLSRRALNYFLPGLSFREYLILAKGIQLPAYTFEDILANKVQFPTGERPLPLFQEYLQKGYYPFFRDPDYAQRLRNIIHLTIENDIPVFAGMNIATARKISQLLYIVAQSVPFKPNYTKIGQMIDSHRNNITDFLYYLEKAGIITQLRADTGGIRALGKVEKLYLDNPNLIYALVENQSNIGNVRETFFQSQIRVIAPVFASAKADFKVKGCTFEIGGQNKGQRQIEGIDQAYIVKDDIEYGDQNIIPLWHFGFAY